jgi:diguanylate cyclase (GGDEF)-like protein
MSAAESIVEVASAPLRVAVAAAPAAGPSVRAALGACAGIAPAFFETVEAALAAGEAQAILIPLDPAAAPGGDPAGAIRACVERAHAPVVGLGERVSPAVIRAAIEAGASDCLELAGDAGRAVALTIARATAHRALLERERARATELAAVLRRAQDALASERAAATTDWMTGLYNKRYFEERLEEEENKAYRTGRPVSLVIADLDHFKGVNDGFGHRVGDRVLRQSAEVIRRCLRNYDVACRFGGEEFAVILPATDRARALEVAERIRLELRAHAFGEPLGARRLTASLGVADLPAPGIATKEELLLAADRALYRAKKEGRDRTCLAEPAIAVRVAGGESGELCGPDLARFERLRASIRDLTTEVERGYLDSLRSLVDLVEEEHGYAFGRAALVSDYARGIATELGLSADQIERVARAGLFQDLGMVPLAPALAHQGRLDAGAWDLVRQHPALSVRIADEVLCLRDELPLILHHHERFDGTGYPRGLKGERIPLGSRILAVATAYEAMTSGRPYRDALEPEAAREEIERLAGIWYDPAVVAGFVAAELEP